MFLDYLQVTYKYVNTGTGITTRRPNELNLSQLAKDGSSKISIPPGMRFSCAAMDISGPVTFLTSQSRLSLDTWKSDRVTSFEFKMKTRDEVSRVKHIKCI